MVAGSLTAKLDKVGAEAFASKLTIEASRTHKKEQAEMIRSLNKLIIMIGITIIPIGIMIFVQSFVNMGRNLKDSITGMAAAVIGMIPEGLYLLSSLALAVSTIRLAADKVLVHDMKCIETLARVDVLCVDKTGTITEPEMEVCGYIVYDGETNIIEQEEFALPPNTADKNGTDENEIDESSAEKCNMIKGLLENYILCMHDYNATMKALKRFVENSCQTAQSDIAENTQAHIQKNTNEISGIQPFSPEKKYSKATINGETCYLGAPDIVMAEAYSKIERDVTAYTEQGRSHCLMHLD